jgi:cell division septation protein DedD
VVSKKRVHRVLAGPFNGKGEADTAAKRMRIDMQINGVLVAPVLQK